MIKKNNIWEDEYNSLMAGFLKTILIIDDDDDILIFVESILKSQLSKIDSTNRYELITCTSGVKGLDLAKKDAPDLIILDVNMPNMSGLEFLKELRSSKDKSLSTVPVLMLTADNETQTVKDALLEGITSYLLKPINENELVKRVVSILDL